MWFLIMSALSLLKWGTFETDTDERRCKLHVYFRAADKIPGIDQNMQLPSKVLVVLSLNCTAEYAVCVTSMIEHAIVQGTAVL